LIWFAMLAYSSLQGVSIHAPLLIKVAGFHSPPTGWFSLPADSVVF
jgi:hypothetical protein